METNKMNENKGFFFIQMKYIQWLASSIATLPRKRANLKNPIRLNNLNVFIMAKQNENAE